MRNLSQYNYTYYCIYTVLYNNNAELFLSQNLNEDQKLAGDCAAAGEEA